MAALTKMTVTPTPRRGLAARAESRHAGAGVGATATATAKDAWGQGRRRGVTGCRQAARLKYVCG